MAVRRRLALVASAAAVAVVLGGFGTGPAAGARDKTAGDAPAIPTSKVYPARKVVSRVAAPKPMAVDVPAAAWPKTGRARVPVRTGAAGASRQVAAQQAVKAGGVGVWARPVKAASAGGELDVAVLTRSAAEKIGSTGLVVQVSAGEDAAEVAGKQVRVGLDYSVFADAFGGDWATRLRVVALPACAATTPQRAECRRRTPVATSNDPRSGQLEATITVPQSASSPTAATATVAPTSSTAVTDQVSSSKVAGTSTGSSAFGKVAATTQVDRTAAVTLAVEAGAAGGAGDFTATSLSPSAAWSAGSNTGGFSWSYALKLPPAPGGPAPQLTFSYSSESVDGRTSSTNNQTSWLGEGFGLEGGFVERKYVPCASDMKDGANNTVKTGDLCWRTDNATLVLGSRSSDLVLDSTTKKWRFEEDDGSKIERFTGMTNGDNDGEYWRLTTPDGTRYYFGRGNRSATDTINTQSTLTVPVAGNHTGEPGHATAFKNSFLTQAWRWNVDYVVDVHGNSMTYLYGRETNRYRQSDAKKSVAYHRAGYLKQIEYGERRGSETTTDAPAQVTFTTAERCIPTSDFDCAASKMVANPSKWPDTPVDQVCTSTTECKQTQSSPTFFTTKRLTRVYSEILNAADGSYPDVDSWALSQSFPRTADGLSPALWLDKITHTGAVGTSVAMPPVTITGDELPNRVEGTDGGPLLYKRRVGSILTETGGQISVSYAKAECVASALPSPASNTKRCFPSYWVPTDGSVSSGDLLGWFHKYPVAQVVESDLVAGGADKVTRYDYLGGGAWHYDDNEFTRPSRRTFSEWRGFAKVRVRTGDSSTPNTLEERTYLRGMDGDGKPGGTKKSVTVTDSQGGEVVDRDRWKGYVLESITYDGINGSTPGKEVQATINTPWISAGTATDGEHTAYLVGTAKSKTRTRLADGTYRTTQTASSYDATYGMVTQTDDLGSTATAADDRCTRLTYNRNTSLGIVDKVSRTETLAVKCSATPNRAKDVISDVRVYYDGATSLTTAPTRGLVTKTERLATHDGTTATYETVGTSTYDSSGRATSATDGAGRTTKTAYAPAAPALTTTMTTTNPLGHVSTVTLNPAWGVATATTDTNGNLTELRYDGLGRVIRAYAADRSRADGETPTAKFSYTVSRSAPSTATTQILNNAGGYTDSYTIYDGLLRVRQTQTHAADSSDRLVSETVYDSRGLAVDARGPFAVTGLPSGTLVVPPSPIPVQTQTIYDGAARPTVAVTKVDGVEKWRTTTSYGGDRISVDPPQGQTPTTSITDARGQLVELRQYHGSSPTGDYDKTRYTYTPAGKQATITGLPSQADPDGAVWSFSYDQRGRLVKTVDPAAGTSEITAYNGADQPVTTKNARGVIWRKYDALGRVTETRKSSSTGALITASVFDTLTGGKGLPTSNTRYTGGQPYVTAVGAYDQRGRATSTSVTIPSVEGKLAGTYTTAKTYAADGNVGLITVPAIGDLPREFVQYDYTKLFQVGSMFSRNTGSLATVTRTPFGDPAQLTLSRSDPVAWQTFTYEEGTRRLERMQLIRHQQTTTDADLTYSYDQGGNITRIVNTPSNGTAADAQCFRYDHQRRLTEAWTSGDSCATAPAQPSAGGSALAGPAPYWHSFSYDPAGNRTKEIIHGTKGDTTRTYTYGKGGGTQPDALTKVDQTGAAGARTDTFGYDATGATVQRLVAGHAQDLTWDLESHLTSVTDGTESTTFVYDASGARLLRRDPDATTLYLDSQELRLDKATDTLTATRYYTLEGAAIAMRTAAGYSYIVSDHHGTGHWQIDATTRAVTQRRTTPFGGERGTPTGTWRGDKGFVGGTTDTSTGLTHLGAREYDPGTGRFISVDPDFDQTSPGSWNGYAYAGSNPVTDSDPTGLCNPSGWCDDGYEQYECYSTIRNGGECGGYVDDPNTGGVGISTSFGVVTWGNPPPATGYKPKTLKEKIGMGFIKFEQGYVDTVYAATHPVQTVKAMQERQEESCNLLESIGGVCQAKIAIEDVKAMADEYGGVTATSYVATNLLTAFWGGRTIIRNPCRCFAEDTQVATEHGDVSIEDIDVGDKVLARNPETGVNELKTVTALHRTHADELLTITAGEAEVVVTPQHPFYVTDVGWVDSGNLKIGDKLFSSDGTSATIENITRKAADTTVYNLTVDGNRNYYVTDAEFLVHNCPSGNQPAPRGPAGSSPKVKRVYEDPGHHNPHGGPNPYNPNKAILPNDAGVQFSRSIQVSGTRWTKIGNGKRAVYYRYFEHSEGAWHWSGSTNGVTASGVQVSIPLDQVPIQVRRSKG